MERKASFTRQEIMDRLSEILALKRTGTFYIATNLNTSCRFSIESGKLTHCSHRHERGIRAIRSFLEITGGSCSFAESQLLPFRQDDAIDHEASLTLLNLHPSPPVRPFPARLHHAHHSNHHNGAQASGY